MKYVCLVYGEEKDLYALTAERGPSSMPIRWPITRSWTRRAS